MKVQQMENWGSTLISLWQEGGGAGVSAYHVVLLGAKIL